MVATPTRFLTFEDIANRALQHVGSQYITTFGSAGDDTKQNDEVSRVFHKVRRAELRRNVWRFATRKTVLYPVTQSMMVFTPEPYDMNTGYAQGAIVTYQTQIWQSRTAGNQGNTPGLDTSIDVLGVPLWVEYFGALVIDQWYPTTLAQQLPPPNNAIGVTTLAYNSGDIVYVSNTTTGPISQAYLAVGGTGYAVGDTGTLVMSGASNDATYIVTSVSSGVVTGFTLTGEGTLYPVTPDGTTEPASTATGGSQPGSGTGFTLNCVVLPAGTQTVWRSLVSNNTSSPLAQFGQWLSIPFASLVQFQLLYPLQAGPLSEDHSRNVFVLPYGYLKMAPQDPKSGSVSYLGAPSARGYDDWTFEGNYFTSQEQYPITFRFVADMQNVSEMDDMFCEGWAARIAVEVCEPLTQSMEKIKNIEGAYRLVMTEARVVNGIETGPVEPPEDDYLECRA